MLLHATKVVSHSSVALWYALNNLFCIYKVTFAIYEIFENYISVNLNLSSNGVEIFV